MSVISGVDNATLLGCCLVHLGGPCPPLVATEDGIIPEQDKVRLWIWVEDGTVKAGTAPQNGITVFLRVDKAGDLWMLSRDSEEITLHGWRPTEATRDPSTPDLTYLFRRWGFLLSDDLRKVTDRNGNPVWFPYPERHAA